MPTATLDGVATYYEIHGTGTPILMCAPGGFDATIEKWRTASAWTGIDALEALGAEHTLILYDRRERGEKWAGAGRPWGIFLVFCLPVVGAVGPAKKWTGSAGPHPPATPKRCS